MKRRAFIKIISFFAAGAIALGGMLVKHHITVKNYHTQISSAYSRFMEDLAVSFNGINTMLEKCMYITSATQLSNIAAQIYHQCETAKNALSQLPAYSPENSNINKFLSQTGNYMLSLAKTTIQKGQIPSQQRTNIEKLREYSDKLTASVDELQIYFTDDKWLNEVEQSFSEIENELTFSAEITNIEQGLTDYPTLIYDGPYSDHILEGESEFVSDKQSVSKTRALEIAATALETDATKLSDDGEESGKIPAYRFKTENCTVVVSKAGGHIVYLRKNPVGGVSLFTDEQAVERAKEYLKRHTALTFEPSYYFTEEGTCTVNFAYKNGATVCYTDLIKIGVCLNTGEIVMVEARGFLMNHKNRTIRTPAYSAEEAREVLSDALQPTKVSQVLIPLNNEEIHCYEFVCNGKNKDKVLVYINTQTLAEEQLLIMIETYGGSLTK